VLPRRIWSLYVKGCEHIWGVLPKFGARCAPTLGSGMFVTNPLLPTWVTMPNLMATGHAVRAYERRSAGKKTGLFASCFSRSFNVIGTDTDRSGTCDFLLATMGLSCTVSKIYRCIGQKLRIFRTKPPISAPQTMFLFELCSGALVQK